jgi:hypothetical protein
MKDSPSVTLRTILSVMGASLAIVVLAGYVLFQARHLITGPQVWLDPEPSIVQTDRQIFLQGEANNIARLWLNGRQIFTDPNGQFKEALVLENGYTIATIRAEDRYGRETRVTRPFVHVPASLIQ